jgi:hypothetical protein
MTSAASSQGTNSSALGLLSTPDVDADLRSVQLECGAVFKVSK